MRVMVAGGTRRRWPILLLALLPALLLVLQACSGPQVDVDPGTDTRDAREVLAAQAKRGPVLVQIFGTAFGADATRRDALVTREIAAGVTGLEVDFTTDPAQAAAPEPRLVVFLNPSNEPSPTRACTVAEEVRLASATERLQIYAVFCERERALRVVRGESAVRGPGDSRVRRLFWQVAGALFPDRYWDHYGLDLIPGLDIGVGGSFGF